MPNTYYNLSNYISDKGSMGSARKYFKNGEYDKAEKEVRSVRSKSYITEKNYLLSKIYYFDKKYDNMITPVFALANKSDNSEWLAEARYYFTLSKLKLKKYEDYMHEAYMINMAHKDSIWSKKLSKFLDQWKSDNKELYEKYKQFYK